MSKLNKTMAAKKAQQVKQLVNGGAMIGGKYIPPYVLGVQAYINMTPYSTLWHPAAQQGWNKEALKEMAQLRVCLCPMRRDKISARLAMYYSAKNETKRAA